MKKYRYVEFTDGFLCSNPAKHGGRLFIVAENPESYVDEFLLTETSGNYGKCYYTTLEKIGELGWDLVSVTPCGSFCFNDGKVNMLYNAYVFKKDIED
jgi:hypothetical protein